MPFFCYSASGSPKSELDKFDLLPTMQAMEWAEEAFVDFGGTQMLFDMLKDNAGRAELLGKLRNRALALIRNETQQDTTNPLFAALEKTTNRTQLFIDFLQRAMPWVAANLDNFLKESSPNEQYKCYIGVKDSKAFEKQFDTQLLSWVPPITKMTAEEIVFVEIDTPGKLVCYVELTGLPLPSIKALDDWYSSYREEDSKVPVHTHKRVSKFVHPRELTSRDIATRAEDFTLFVEAVALGVLMRESRGDDAGLYKLYLKEGREPRSIGDEKLMRMDGIHTFHRKTIQQQVEACLDKIRSEDQIALWAALMEYYHENVYPLALQKVKEVELDLKSLPTLLCERLQEKWTSRLNNIAGDKKARLLQTARGSLSKFTEEIPGSTDDVYKFEVAVNKFLPKRVLKHEVFEDGWSMGGYPKELAYFVAVNGQQTGPHNSAMLQQLAATGQLTHHTKVWEHGMAEWVEARTVPELQNFFGTPPPLNGGLPPPLVV